MKMLGEWQILMHYALMQTMRSAAYQILSTFIDAVLPPRCVVTGEIVERQGTIAPAAWSQIDFISAPYCACCGLPFEFTVAADALCAACLADRPVYETARAALVYNEKSRPLILGFKHGDQTHVVRAFTPWLTRAGQEMLAQADALIPVPLHRWRLLARRYNQAALMARALGRETGLPVWPMALQRVRPTPSQGHLKPAQRFANVRKAFAAPPDQAEKIQGKRVVLIDDVLTTGATVQECASVLLKAGAARVDVLTLARVVRAERL